MEPIYNHDSFDTSYLVSDYPYGSLRCEIRYWMERSDKKGFRFVARTRNPKTLRQNAPKKNTYSRLAGAMYLDDNRHCKWASLSEYSTSKEVAEFIKKFPQADFWFLEVFTMAKIVYLTKCASGSAVWSINGVAKPTTEYELDEYAKELEEWREIAKTFKKD